MKIDEIIQDLERKHPNEPEYIQAVTEVLHSVEEIYYQHPEFEKAKIIERMVEPDRILTFRVTWVDDKGEVQTNLGYRVQYNNAIGPYKGGLRFHASVNLSILKFLGFEQTFKNALTSLPMGGGKGSYYVYTNFAGSKIFKVIVMIPTVISAMLMALITQRMIYKMPSIFDGFPNLLTDQQHVFMTTTIYSLWVGFSTALIIYPNQINAIDKELIESAQLDGATHLQIIWHVIIPLLIPTISTFMVTGVAGILSDMGPLYSFFGLEASKNASLTGYIIYQLTIKYKKPQYGYVSALGLLCTLLALPVTLLVKKLMDRIDPMEEHLPKGRRRRG